MPARRPARRRATRPRSTHRRRRVGARRLRLAGQDCAERYRRRMMPKRFTAPRIVHAVVDAMAGDLRAVARSRALWPSEARQVDATEALADALRGAAREEPQPTFGEAFAPLRELFSAADAATREGAIAVPTEANRHPFSVTPISLASFGC